MEARRHSCPKSHLASGIRPWLVDRGSRRGLCMAPLVSCHNGPTQMQARLPTPEYRWQRIGSCCPGARDRGRGVYAVTSGGGIVDQCEMLARRSREAKVWRLARGPLCIMCGHGHECSYLRGRRRRTSKFSRGTILGWSLLGSGLAYGRLRQHSVLWRLRVARPKTSRQGPGSLLAMLQLRALARHDGAGCNVRESLSPAPSKAEDEISADPRQQHRPAEGSWRRFEVQS